MAETETGLTLIEKNKATLTQLVLVNMPFGTSEHEAARVALKEISNFEMLAQTNPSLLACTPRSALLAVKQCICDNLTLAPSAGLVYLVPGQVKVGQNGNQDVYEWVITYDPTSNGRLSIARQSGRIIDHKRPVIEYDEGGKVKSATVEFLVPSFQKPRWEKIVFTSVHFTKWQNASAKKNKGAANTNYTSWLGGIDPEFAGTKAIRHGLGKLGANMNEVPRVMQPGRAQPEWKNNAGKVDFPDPIPYTPATDLNKDPEIEETEDAPHEEIHPAANVTAPVPEHTINPDLL